MPRKTVGIVLFDEVEVLDYCGPFEVFSVTRLDESRRREQPSPFQVVLVAQTEQPIVTTGGMRVLPEVDFAHCPPLDILVVPGGWGTRAAMHDPALQAFVTARARQVELLASVCTGALILGQAGLLEGRRATTHWLALDLLHESFPAVRVDRTSHVVEDGAVLTSAGIAAGIDLALKVVARCYGEAVARATARYMEYPFPDSNARRVALEPR
jgi:transcriptional regulator GlxA family with amidase domain